MIAIVDYGVGNLFSLASSLKYLGLDAKITGDAKVIKSAERIILPGVGAFADAKAKLDRSGMTEVVLDEAENGKPLLGICLGMQMLFERSYEYGEHEGLGLVKGVVAPIEDDVTERVKVPHMGWNSLEFKGESPIFKYVDDGEYVYYVHSYYAKNCAESTIAVSDYGGIKITGAVSNGSVYGTQFHPEKSGDTGLRILKAFSEL